MIRAVRKRKGTVELIDPKGRRWIATRREDTGNWLVESAHDGGLTHATSYLTIHDARWGLRYVSQHFDQLRILWS